MRRSERIAAQKKSGVETKKAQKDANDQKRCNVPGSNLRRRNPVHKSARQKRQHTSQSKKFELKKLDPVLPLSVHIAASNIERSCSQTLFGITNAETVEMVFPNWLKRAFSGMEHNATYCPLNLNMPAKVIQRPVAHYQLDSPITEHGTICSLLIARGIIYANYRPSVIFTSPELRCIQTGHSMRTYINQAYDCELCVEPSLAEYTEFRQDAHKYWLSHAELQHKGEIETSKTYEPLLRVDQLPENETPQEFVHRLQQFYEHIIKNNDIKCAIIVSNITGIFVLADGTATIPWHLQAPHAYMSSSHLHTIEVKPRGSIEVIKDAILPLTRTLYEAKLRASSA